MYKNQIRVRRKFIIALTLICLTELIVVPLLENNVLPLPAVFFSFNTNFNDISAEENSVKKTNPNPNGAYSWRDLSILCVVHTCSRNLQGRAKYVKKTWSKLCNKTLFLSDENDPIFPTIKVTNRTGFGEVWAKTRKGMEMLYSKYLNKFDWFFKADDDTYVIMDNLRKFLFKKDSKRLEFYGKVMKNGLSKEGYLQGGAGYAFGNRALERLVEDGFENRTKCQSEDFSSHSDDVFLGLCLANSGITLATDCFDGQGRELFHHKDFHTQICYRWFKRKSFYRRASSKRALEKCCSNESISFHTIYGTDQLILDLVLKEKRFRHGISNLLTISSP